MDPDVDRSSRHHRTDAEKAPVMRVMRGMSVTRVAGSTLISSLGPPRGGHVKECSKRDSGASSPRGMLTHVESARPQQEASPTIQVELRCPLLPARTAVRLKPSTHTSTSVPFPMRVTRAAMLGPLTRCSFERPIKSSSARTGRSGVAWQTGTFECTTRETDGPS